MHMPRHMAIACCLPVIAPTSLAVWWFFELMTSYTRLTHFVNRKTKIHGEKVCSGVRIVQIYANKGALPCAAQALYRQTGLRMV